MDAKLRIAVFNTQEQQVKCFRDLIARQHGLELEAEATSWEQLEPHLSSEHEIVDIVLVNLDPDLAAGQQVVHQIVHAVPDMRVIGVSSRTDPESIISSMRAGCTQFVCAPVDEKDFRSAVERIRSIRRSAPHTSRRICVVGASGGVGATTVACNLAMELASVTKRICALMDLNLEYGDVSFNFDCTPRYSIADVCDSRSQVDKTLIEGAMHALPCDVALLCRPEKLADSHQVTPEGVEQTLKILAQMYANLVIDVPRMFSFLNSPALDGADLVLIVAQLSVPSVRNASRVYDLLQQMGAKEECLEIVLNRSPAEYQRVTVHDVEEHFGRPVFAMIPNDYRRVTASLDFGQPIVTDSPNSPARLAIHELAKSIVKSRRPEDARSAEGDKGLFKRWWGRSKKETVPAR